MQERESVRTSSIMERKRTNSSEFTPLSSVRCLSRRKVMRVVSNEGNHLDLCGITIVARLGSEFWDYPTR